jgi:hypothetical protein
MSMRGATGRGQGDADGAGLNDPGGAGAEFVEPTLSPDTFPHAPELGTVPLRYRRQAAAYFDRLRQDEEGKP